MSLSAKHIAFVDEYMLNGFHATNAYKSVYGCSQKSAEAAGPKLSNSPEIKEEIERRQRENFNLNIISREEIIQTAKEIMLINKKKAPMIALKSIEILNKMLGYNSPDKIEMSGNIEQPLFPDVKYDDKKGE
jgi:phage terminase small subunit